MAGCVRVAAPAGSGKTRVLTARLAELLGPRGVESELVLALAYNTDAAAQLRERCGAQGIRGARATTIHAHALAILTRHRGAPAVWDERQARAALAGIVQPEPRANTDPLGPYLEALERVRGALVPPEKVMTERADVPDLPVVLAAYRARLSRAGAVDFPEMVCAAVELLLTDPTARRAEQARAHHVLLDELQDLTPLYLLLVRLLASPQLAVFGVGDDDQVLYDHVGATPRYLLDFEALFPGAAEQPLTVNYRCPPAIVSYACNLLARNQERVPKQITAAPGRADLDDAVRLVEVPATQQAAAAGQVLELWLRDRRPQDIAVLARVNVALLPVQVELALAGIPHTSPVGPALLERTGVRSALAYLRLATAAHGALDGADLAEVLYRPFRPLPGDLRDALRGRRWTVAALARLGADRLEGRSLTSWQQLVSDLSQLRDAAQQGQPSAELLRLVRDHVGVDRAAGDLDASGDSSVGASHVDDLDALALIALRCPDPARLPTFLLEMLGLSVPSGTPAVRLSSVHRVKGLEWPCVLLVGAAERLCPHRLAIGPAALEAERRVWHVAITRARERLAVVVPVPGASRFLAEMLEAPTLAAQPGPTRGRPAIAGAPRQPTAARPGAITPSPRTRLIAAVAGLRLQAPGGLRGEVAATTPSAALLRTASGALLAVPYGSRVTAGDTAGRLVAPGTAA